MKTLKAITNKIILFTGIVAGAFILSTVIVQAEPINEKDSINNVAKVNMVESEVMDILENDYEEVFEELDLFQEPVVKIYDGGENLIFEGNLNDIDNTLRNLINRSDLIMDYQNIKYYRLNN